MDSWQSNEINLLLNIYICIKRCPLSDLPHSLINAVSASVTGIFSDLWVSSSGHGAVFCACCSSDVRVPLMDSWKFNEINLLVKSVHIKGAHPCLDRIWPSALSPPLPCKRRLCIRYRNPQWSIRDVSLSISSQIPVNPGNYLRNPNPNCPQSHATSSVMRSETAEAAAHKRDPGGNGTEAGGSTSRALIETANGSHWFTIRGYSLAKGMGTGKYISSDVFTVGGFNWAIYFYPDGKNPEDNSVYVSVFIALASEGSDVRALFELTLIDQSGKGKHKVHSHFDRALESGPYTLKYQGSMWYFFKSSSLFLSTK